MKEKEEIEKLFKDTFEHFEAEVDPGLWSGISGKLAASAGSTASSAAVFTAGKIIAGVASVALVAGSIWYFNVPEKETTPGVVTQQPVATTPVQPADNDEQPASAEPVQPTTAASTPEQPASTMPPAIRTLNHYSTEGYPPLAQQNQKNNSTVVSSDVSELDHPATPPASKYGNATQGDGGMIRGTNASSAPGQGAAFRQEEGVSAPVASIFVNTSSGEAPLTVDFICQGAVPGLVWDFDNGRSSRENSPTHVFDRAGNYTVKLRNTAGHVIDKVNIEVKQAVYFTNIANIFTPNGDGENDYFFFDTKNIVTIGVAIYSQKEGKQVYSWNTLDGSWNGKLMNGQDAPDGVYLYSIQAIGTDGLTHPKTGFVTLSRKRAN